MTDEEEVIAKRELRDFLGEKSREAGESQEWLAKHYRTTPRTIRKLVAHGDDSLPNGLLTYMLLKRYGGVTFRVSSKEETNAAKLDRIEKLLEERLSTPLEDVLVELWNAQKLPPPDEEQDDPRSAGGRRSL